MKILNLFAGIGGNRTLWGDEHEITSVEYDQHIAMIYHKRFPNDRIIISDAYRYCLDHYFEFDIIWGSPPCTTHTRLIRCASGHKYNNNLDFKMEMPDLRLYSLILFLKENFRGNWIIENVKTYYKPLIQPNTQVGKHWIWTNKAIPKKKQISREYGDLLGDLSNIKKVDLKDLEYPNIDKRRILRNCVNPEHGKYILDSLIDKKQESILNFVK